ncbi:ATP-binding protein [Pararhizobium sp. DWP1-1-3]|uniref:ATP-binding protein n=1 Tax=Pararhizobium sp. DWP1-1-3 TaxID=2804652 RepID=UPI003CEE62D9
MDDFSKAATPDQPSVTTLRGELPTHLDARLWTGFALGDRTSSDGRDPRRKRIGTVFRGRRRSGAKLRSRQIEARLFLGTPMRSVSCERFLLQQVLSKIMLTAAEAISCVECPRKICLVTQENQRGHVNVRLEDYGLRQDPVAFDQVFEAFYSTKPDGKGMGLAICRSIVEVHGGKIIAHPGPSGGAFFELTIPCARGH